MKAATVFCLWPLLVGAPLSAADTAGHDIQGTWIVTVTPTPGGPAPYVSLGTYAIGGTLIVSADPSLGTATSTG
jgi:hypothetical protein